MDLLTFISNVWDSAGDFAWPVVVFIGLCLFREPIKKVILSLKVLRYRSFELELGEPEKISDQEINIITSYLQRSPHSFRWFRDNTEIQYTDAQFETLLEKHKNILEPITIVSRDKKKRKEMPGLPGMRLTREYRQTLSKAMQAP